MDLLICAAECLDVHVVNGFPEPHRVAINALVDVAGLSRYCGERSGPHLLEKLLQW